MLDFARVAPIMQPYETSTAPEQKLIAPWPHTLAVCLVLASTGFSGFLRAHTGSLSANYTLLTLSRVVSQFLLFGSVVAGVYQREYFFHTALRRGRRAWSNELGFALLIYVIGLGLVVLCTLALRPLHLPRAETTLLRSMMPQTAFQLVPWFILSLAAGFCEEIVFRGYLLQQVARLSGSPHLAVTLTSLLFGLMHVYEGWSAVASLTALAALYAVIALRRGNIIAVAISHGLLDTLAGLIHLARHHS